MAKPQSNSSDKLESYRHKRDFAKTPEPSGGEAGDSGGVFVVQKHAATHLHYDFRLELEGVLKSWAVPKGPSLDPGEKRLAMQVEDHPLEYGGFEGVIPKGEYGGGTVMVWDAGRWLPIGNKHEAYRRGALKFELLGQKLKGRWALVRLKSEEEEKPSWLLFKEKDDEAVEGDGDGVLKRLPSSAATGRSMEAIATEKESIWTRNGSHDAASAEMLETAGAIRSDLKAFLAPQLATLASSPPVGAGWLHEVKHDGYRLLCRIDNSDIKFFTRKGNDWTNQFPTLVATARNIPSTRAWIDGEAVILRADGTSSFQELQNALGERREGEITYFAFDLLHLNGYDLRMLPLQRRKEFLARLIGGRHGNIRYGDHWEGEGAEFFTQACAMNAEGVISKRADAGYFSGRNRNWLKIKCKNRQEFVIGGFTDPTGQRRGFGALLVGAHDSEGTLIYAGRVGTGFNERMLKEMYPLLAETEQDFPPFINVPRGKAGKKVHWVKPSLVAEVEFAEMTAEGILRHPSFQGLRRDKLASEVFLEQPETVARGGQIPVWEETAVAAEQPATEEVAAQRVGSMTFAHVRFTNPDRILYQEQKFTKIELAHYYQGVYQRMIPHLANRPLTLVRCPTGHNQGCFFQKHAHAGVSHFIKRVKIRENEKLEDYMTVDDLQGLLSLVQMGVLEIHTWNSRRDQLEYPDKVVFDLDPDEGLPWEDLAEGALLLRDRLLDYGLENFIKTTGGKGFHIVVPVLPEKDWEQVREFAKWVAEGLASDYPSKFTPKMTKVKRSGRIFLDWMRNIRGATAVEVYSTRSRPAASVSAPISWEELATGVSSADFTIANMGARLERQEKDPWDGYFGVRQSVPAL